jgi:hypothetical protein
MAPLLLEWLSEEFRIFKKNYNEKTLCHSFSDCDFLQKQ